MKTLKLHIDPAHTVEELANRLETVAAKLRAGWRQGSERGEFTFGVSSDDERRCATDCGMLAVDGDIYCAACRSGMDR